MDGREEVPRRFNNAFKRGGLHFLEIYFSSQGGAYRAVCTPVYDVDCVVYLAVVPKTGDNQQRLIDAFAGRSSEIKEYARSQADRSSS